MNILSNSIIQDLIQNVYKGVTETFNYVLERYNSNDVFAYSLYIDDYCSYLGWAANTISHYEIEKLNYPKEEHPFIKCKFSSSIPIIHNIFTYMPHMGRSNSQLTYHAAP